MTILGRTATMPKGSLLPNGELWWFDRPNGSLHDFSSGWTITAEVGKAETDTGKISIAAGQITGAAGSGDGDDDADVPNVTIAWPASSIETLAVDRYMVTVTATRDSDSKPLIGSYDLVITSGVGA